jgi:hypothetical protein
LESQDQTVGIHEESIDVHIEAPGEDCLSDPLIANEEE